MTEPTTTPSDDLEQGSQLRLDFNKLGAVAQTGASVLPVVVQDADSLEVLILAYANELALQHTIETGSATFWSTSRNRLWVKGETSGDTLKIVDIRVNCEQNSLVYLVRPQGDLLEHSGHVLVLGAPEDHDKRIVIDVSAQRSDQRSYRHGIVRSVDDNSRLVVDLLHPAGQVRLRQALNHSLLRQ